jgi:PAS domain S-box-containing protein
MKSFTQSLFRPVYRSLTKLWDWLTIPSDVITEVGMRRQAQFLAAVSLLMLVMLFLQTCVSFLTHRFELGITLALLWISVVFVYGFSRSKSPHWGSVLLVYGFTLFAFVLVNRRSADVNTTLYGMIPIAYLLAGVLLSIGWQIALVTLVLAGSVVLGTMQTALSVNMNLMGGNLIALGVVLILTSKLRDGIERRRLDQVRQINRELEAARDDLDKERTLLRSSEARTRALLTAVPDMIFELSREGVFLDFVPSTTLGPILPPENFLGRNITDVMPPEIAEATLHTVQQALTNGQVQTFEYQLPLSGAPRHYEARMAASGPDAVLAIVRDITDRREAEEALRESESRFRSFVEEITDGIMFFNRQGMVIEWNSSMERMTGLERQQALGIQVWDVQMKYTPDEEKKDLGLEQLKLRFRQIFETGNLPTRYQVGIETGIQHMDGSRRVAEERLFLLKSIQGFALGVVIHDITERKQAEAALQTSENLFRLAFRSSPLPYCITLLKDGRYVDVNEAYLQMIGYSREDVIGHTTLELKQWAFEDERAAFAGALRAAGQIRNLDGDIITRSGGTRNLIVNYDLLFINNEAHVLSLFFDITDRKKAEAEREALIKDLEARNAELERFTYTVSHDLKSPLITIRGFLGFIEKDAQSGNAERLKTDLQRVSDATDKMQRLLNELLELSRVGRLMNPSETMPFEDLARTAVDIVDGQLKVRGITVTLQPNLPAVYGDRQRLVEVLQNLLDNAIKFMGDQPNPCIEIGQRGEDAERGKPVFYVKDNGIGIAPEHHERIFGLFNQLDPTMEGTGVGLALVKRIIEFHGGRIWVKSEVGKGSTFCFTLGKEDTN